MRSARRTGRMVAGLMVAGVALAGCTAPRPEVTFYAGGTAVTAKATLWCEVDYTVGTGDCPAPATANIVRLFTRPGRPVEVSVDGRIAEAPWQVYAQYLTADGTVNEVRSPLFGPNDRLAYTLRPPQPTDQLVRVEVQAQPVLLPSATGSGVDYGFARVWVVDVQPKASSL